MDVLDRVAGPARDLLSQVDRVLARSGAPADDPVWPLLRRLGALPGDLVTALLAARPAPLFAAADELRSVSGQLATAAAEVPGPAHWHGEAAEAFTAAWRELAALLGTGPGTLPGRYADAGDFADEAARWLTRTRRQVAGAVATCLASAEAATLRRAPADPLAAPAGAKPGTAAADAAGAAAAIATHILRAAQEALEDGQHLRDRWAARLAGADAVAVPAAYPPGRPGRLEVG